MVLPVVHVHHIKASRRSNNKDVVAAVRILIAAALIIVIIIIIISGLFLLVISNNNNASPPLLPDKVSTKATTATPTNTTTTTSTTTTTNANTTTTTTGEPKATIAYVWTLAKCSDFQSSTAGMIDAALVLRHSIHRNSWRTGASKYDYHMYVLVHPAAAACTTELYRAGYTVVLKDPPVDLSDIQNTFYRERVSKEWCCGEAEFIKLYAYTLTDHPVVVHLDIDFILLQPHDELFDAMIDPPGSTERSIAQATLSTMFPETTTAATTTATLLIPNTIEAYMTRDYQQLIPGDPIALFQAGFMVIQPNVQVFDELVAIIKKGNFLPATGWDGLGYGRRVGAMAMQGLIAYYYDAVRKGVSLELNMCRYNWMGGDVRYRSVPNWYPGKHPDKKGKCRNGRPTCEDCQATPTELIKSAHYTNCRKPWNCIGFEWVRGQKKDALGVDVRNTNFDKCMDIVTKWHDVRTEMEDAVIQQTGNHTLATLWRSGTIRTQVFQGHCNGDGQKGYIPMSGGVDATIFSHAYKKSLSRNPALSSKI